MNVKKFKENFKKPEYLKVFILRLIGNLLIFTSLFMIVKTFYQPVREELRYLIDKTTNKKYIISDVKIGKKTTLVDLFEKNKIETIIPEDPAFSIVIPKIGANAKVLP